MKRPPNKSLPSLKVLNHLFYIDKTSPSGLRWLNPSAPCKKSGDIAGTKMSNGYWRVTISIGKKPCKFFAHRIIYYLINEEDPKEHQVDHIIDKTNNVQLRKATPVQNRGNSLKPRLNSSSKYKGVTQRKLRNGVMWECNLMHQNKNIYLGRFKSEKEAAIAYNNAALDLLGEFARLNTVE